MKEIDIVDVREPFGRAHAHSWFYSLFEFYKGDNQGLTLRPYYSEIAGSVRNTGPVKASKTE